MGGVRVVALAGGRGVALERMAWTDERIDDLVMRIDRGFDELRDEMREMRGEMAAMHRQQATIGWGIAGALCVQLIAFVITQA